MDPAAKAKAQAGLTIKPQQSNVFQSTGIVKMESIVPNTCQMKQEAIKIPVVANLPKLPHQSVKKEPSEEPPIKKPKISVPGPPTQSGVITATPRYPSPALVAIDPQQIAGTPFQTLPSASVPSPLFQPTFQTVFLQPTPLPSSPVKAPVTGPPWIAKPYQAIASKNSPLPPGSPRLPNSTTNPILMHPGLSNKIVVHAPSSQSGSSPPQSSPQPLAMTLGQVGSVNSQAIPLQSPIQSPTVLSSGRLVHLQSAGGTQKYILVPPGTAPHLLGNASQLALQGAVGPVVPTSRQEKSLSVINTSQGSVTVQMSQSTPVIVHSSTQSMNRFPPIPQPKRLPGNVQARYVHKSQLSGAQLAQVAATSAARPPSQNKVITVGQHVGAITNRTSTVSTVASPVSIATTAAVVSKTGQHVTVSSIAQPTTPTMGPVTLSNGQHGLVLHNFKQILNGTPVILNLPSGSSSKKQPQTAILVPPPGKQTPPAVQPKVIKSTQPLTVNVPISMSTGGNRTISPNVQAALQNKIKLVSCMQPTTTTPSPVTTQNPINSSSTRCVAVSSAPIMSSTTTMVQNGRLLQLHPAKRGPVFAAIQPRIKKRGSKRPLAAVQPPQLPVEMSPNQNEISAVDLALKLKAPFPQAYIRRPARKAKQTGTTAVAAATPSAGDVKEPPKTELAQPKAAGTVAKAQDEGTQGVEFTWNEYLEITGTYAAPNHSFKHIEASLVSVIKVGMMVEAPNPPSTLNPFQTYWVASVISVCRSLLLLRYVGCAEDRSADFWCDLDSKVLHPVGWCARNGQMLQPPDALLSKKLQWQQFLIASLTGAKSIPEHILTGEFGHFPTDKLQRGRYLDVIDENVPTQAWIASIIENYGGRLRLRYSGTKEGNDFFIFYLSFRLHPPGWAKEHRVIIKPPKFIQQQMPSSSEKHWRSMYFGIVAAANLSTLLPSDFFKIRKSFAKIKVNSMKEGMKLEAVNPRAPHQICPATITKNFNLYFFQVQIDIVDRGVEKEKVMFVCHAESGGVFPANWCKENGVQLTPPKGYSRPKFKWSEYLRSQNSTTAPPELFRTSTTADRKFQKGMKLEAVSPFNSSVISVATVTKVAGRHIWLHFDGSKQPNHIVDSESQDLYPVGWCESVGYPLKSPKRLMAHQKRRVAIVCPEKRLLGDTVTGHDLYQKVRDANQYDDSEGWMPQVYINHKCFSGPYLNKRRLAELPQATGPGMVTLVLREVLSSLINSAYKPNKVLRELQVTNEATAGQNGYLQVMKAKHKGKSLRALVELPKTVPKVLAFLHQTLTKLESCPNLVSLTPSGDDCPQKCSLNMKPNYRGHCRLKEPWSFRSWYRGSLMNHNLLPRLPFFIPSEGQQVNPRIWQLSQILEEQRKFFYGGKRKKKGHSSKQPKKKKMMMMDMTRNGEEEEQLMERPVPDNSTMVAETTPNVGSGTVAVPAISPVKTPLMTRARHIIQTAKLAKATAPRLILPDRKRRGINMMRLTANLRSTRPKKDPSHVKKSSNSSKTSSSKKSHKKSSGKDKSSKLAPSSSGKMSPESLHLESNPLEWSVDKVVEFLTETDCASLATVFREQEIDGQALLLLTLPTVQECMDLKLGPAIKLCHHIERIKIAFYEQFAK